MPKLIKENLPEPTMNQHGMFGIEISFQKETESPERIFRTLSELIETFSNFDRDLINIIDVKIEPLILLENIESGSIKTWLITKLEKLDDEALKSGDWRKIIGNYLVEAKYAVIDFLKDKTEISSKEEILNLNDYLYHLAEKTGVKYIPTYTKLPLNTLIKNIDNINNSLSHLNLTEKAKFLVKGKETYFNLQFNFSPEEIEELVTKEIKQNTGTFILKVKKPDYLGESQWEFKHQGKTILAKINDKEWLNKFQMRKIDIRPGDSIEADVEQTINYGYDYEVISIKYAVIKVKRVIPLPSPNQDSLPF